MSDKIGAGGKSPCSVRNMPSPQTIICSKCGCDVKIWTDEPDATCQACKQNMTLTS
jgi:hypothetical protein